MDIVYLYGYRIFRSHSFALSNFPVYSVLMSTQVVLPHVYRIYMLGLLLFLALIVPLL